MVQRPVGKRLKASVVLAGLVLAGSLGACSNGSEAGTLDQQSSTGVQLDVGDLRIRNAVIVAADNGALTVSMTVVNTGSTEDAITGLGLTGDGDPVIAVLNPRSIKLAPKSVTLVPGETRPRIDLDLDLLAGGYAPVSVQFENAGTIALSLPVVSASSVYGGGGADQGSPA